MKSTLKIFLLPILLVALCITAQAQDMCPQWKQQCLSDTSSPVCKQYRLRCSGGKTSQNAPDASGVVVNVSNNTPFQVKLAWVQHLEENGKSTVTRINPPTEIKPWSTAALKKLSLKEGRYLFHFEGGFKASVTRRGDSSYAYDYLSVDHTVVIPSHPPETFMTALTTKDFKFTGVGYPPSTARPSFYTNPSLISFVKGPFADLTLTNQADFPVTVYQAQVFQDPNKVPIAKQVNLKNAPRDERLWQLATLKPGESRTLNAVLGVGRNHIIALPPQEVFNGGELFHASVTVDNQGAKTFESPPRTIVITQNRFN